MGEQEESTKEHRGSIEGAQREHGGAKARKGP